MTRIYLDNNATTPLFPEVRTRIDQELQYAFANPGSAHSFGRDARRVLEDSRERIAALLNADPSEVIFTSGGTESINMAVHGLTYGRTGTIALTAGEHPATQMAVSRACQQGLQSIVLNVDAAGQLIQDQFDALPWSSLRLVCVILAHNETGVIQNVFRLSQMCAQHGVPLLLDAVQAVGKIPVDFRMLNATAVAFGAHKFHGPRGIGGLLVRRGVRMVPLLEGGHQENDRRAGTEPVALVAGMEQALTCLNQSGVERTDAIRTMRDQLQARLQKECAPTIVHGELTERLPNTLSIAFVGIDGEPLLVNLHLAEIACSLGSTCASGAAEPAPSLLAMGLPPEICQSSVRFSLSALNTTVELEEAADRIVQIVKTMRNDRQIVLNT